MARREWATIGLAIAEGDSYASWFSELMTHAGLSFHEFESGEFGDLNSYDVLVLAGYSELDSNQRNALLRWLNTGGHLVVCGSTWGLDDLLGVTESSKTRFSRSALVAPENEDRLWPEGVGKTVFIGGSKVVADTAEVVIETESGELAVSRKGRCIFIAPHVAQTVAMMYLGRSVETDAIGPGDGTVHLENGVLRAEDGTIFSYENDREHVEGSTAPCFTKAHADAVRQIFVRAIYESLEKCNKPAYVTWHWPESADAVASVSVDCDSGGPDEIMSIYRCLSNYGMPATWMVPIPGLPNDVYRMFRKWGHTPGLLYQPDNQFEPLDQLKLHHRQISRGAGSVGVPCIKLEDGQWIGLTDIYEVGERAGATLSVGKGGIQAGSTGFLYGSSHIHFPIARNGKRFQIGELPYIVHKPGIVAETSQVQALVDEVKLHYGCMHINLVLSDAKEQELGLQDALMLVRQSGMHRYSPEQLGVYEQARRDVLIRAGKRQISFISDREFSGFTFMIFGGEHEAIVNGRKYSPNAVNRYGTLFTSFVMNLEQKEQLDLELQAQQKAA